MTKFIREFEAVTLNNNFDSKSKEQTYNKINLLIGHHFIIFIFPLVERQLIALIWKLRRRIRRHLLLYWMGMLEDSPQGKLENMISLNIHEESEELIVLYRQSLKFSLNYFLEKRLAIGIGKTLKSFFN